jgi:hypothetical protein
VGLSLLSPFAARADFLPPNNLHLEDGLLRGVQLTEQDFNDAIDEAEAIYKPLIQQTFGARLRFNRLWTNSTVNASASQSGSTWDVNMYGGLARRPEITRDGFSIVICHELGHHLGGYPFSSAWAANEGQSDYFATLSCARLLWKDQVEKNAESAELIPDLPKAKCDATWETEDDRNLCYRLMLAGKSTADLLSALGGTVAKWDSPDPKKVSSTNNAHPQGQCRLDTYIAGALCVAEFDENLIPGKALGGRRNSADAERESAKYTCTPVDSFEIGTRPLCWFKPFLP